MDVNKSKRDFMLAGLGAAAGVGGVASLYAMAKTWSPLPSVVAAGVTKVDIAAMKSGEVKMVEFRGKPVFIVKKTPDMCASDSVRNIKIGDSEYTLLIGVCTHLGCIPTWEPEKKLFHCPCHGGEFDANGKNIFGPPPRPLVIPPFKIEGTSILIGEEGDEYKKIPAEFKA